jgi:hypothetical protein
MQFLIQSDFITLASREDIPADPWNHRLLKEVASTFCDNIDDFLLHPTLKYRWIQYFSTNGVADEFWSGLQKSLFIALQKRAAFFDQNDELQKACDLKITPNEFSDEAEVPLIPTCDCCVGEYISAEYDLHREIPQIAGLGASKLSINEFIHYLEYDLKHEESLMKGTPHDSNWHTLISNVLLEHIRKSDKILGQVQLLPIIPLAKENSWVIPKNGSIFLPTCGGVDIPSDLLLNLVVPEALENASRKLLFLKLGITECPVLTVFDMIKDKHKYRGRLKGVTRLDLQNHMKFLYWHHDKLSGHAVSDHIQVATVNMKCVCKKMEKWIYHSNTTNVYSTYKIMGCPVPDNLSTDLCILHPGYYLHLGCEQRHGKNGVEWLEEYLELKTFPQIRKRGKKEPSIEFEYIAKHASQLLLGVLRSSWSPTLSNVLISWISQFEVPILNSENKRILAKAFLPLPRLTKLVTDLNLEADFGFVKELDKVTDSEASQWTFLTKLGVGVQEDFSFWLAILKQARRTSVVSLSTMAEIYRKLLVFHSTDDHTKTLQ